MTIIIGDKPQQGGSQIVSPRAMRGTLVTQPDRQIVVVKPILNPDFLSGGAKIQTSHSVPLPVETNKYSSVATGLDTSGV